MGTVDLNGTRQPVLGFGATQSFNGETLLAEEGRDRVYRAVFVDLKLDYIRLRNYYDYEGQQAAYETQIKDFVAGAARYSPEPERGKPPVKIVFTSWSPPARLKSSGRLNGTLDGTKDGIKNVTLAKNPSGGFDYEGFADWWLASLRDFRRLTGRYPDLISLQNELDIAVPYEGCEFLGSEGENAEGYEMAGYDKALAATHAKITSALGADAPGITGPETFTIRLDSGDSQVRRYIDLETDQGKKTYGLLEAVSFHIYGNGAERDDPTLYRKSLIRLRQLFRPNNTGKPLMQTEFMKAVDLTQQASMISDAFVYGDISAYFTWMLARVIPNPGNALVYYNPSDKSVERRGLFYAVKHFSQFIGAGWHRVDASLEHSNALLFFSSKPAGVRIAAFLKDDGSEAVVVLINNGKTSRSVDLRGIGFTKTEVFRSSETEAGEKFRNLGSLVDGKVFLPSRSVATVHYTNEALLKAPAHSQASL